MLEEELRRNYSGSSKVVELCTWSDCIIFYSVTRSVVVLYGYSQDPDNPAGTEYIFMEFIEGKKLSEVWLELQEPNIISILRQIAQLESQMMSIAFPAGGALYYTRDLEKMSGTMTVPLEDERFCVGPDTRLHMWYGRRSQLDVHRGPYESAKATLVAAAHKEIAYLTKFSQPLLPFRRARRPSYQFREQLPSDHIENLKRYLLIAPSLVPKDSTLCHFSLRHPDLQHSNIIVQRQSDEPTSDWQIASLLDWQHTSILPLFLLAGIPQRIQNYNDPISQTLTPPSLPEKFEALDEEEQAGVMELYRQRLGHFHYVMNTEAYNKSHHKALMAPMRMLRNRLFECAGYPWEGETVDLKVPLIQATENWEILVGEGVGPCPIAFDTEDVRETMELNEKVGKADTLFEMWQGVFGVGSEGWVPAQCYEGTLSHCRRVKEEILEEEEDDDGRAEILGHWPWDDMDEEKYM